MIAIKFKQKYMYTCITYLTKYMQKIHQLDSKTFLSLKITPPYPGKGAVEILEKKMKSFYSVEL